MLLHRQVLRSVLISIRRTRRHYVFSLVAKICDCDTCHPGGAAPRRFVYCCASGFTGALCESVDSCSDDCVDASTSACIENGNIDNDCCIGVRLAMLAPRLNPKQTVCLIVGCL